MIKLFLDVETTGTLEDSSKIWAIAFIAIKNDKDVVSEFEIKFCPTNYKLSDFNIQRGIDQDYLESLGGASKALKSLTKELSRIKKLGGRMMLYGWHVGFDYSHLFRLFDEFGLSLMTYLYPTYVDVKSIVMDSIPPEQLTEIDPMDLPTFAHLYGFPMDLDQLHDAMHDIKTTAKIYYSHKNS